MSRKKLIKQLKIKYPQLNKFELETVLDNFSNNISIALKNGKSVEIRGLGRWYLKTLDENFNARNPATNELIYKPNRINIRLKLSKKLKKLINE